MSVGILLVTHENSGQILAKTTRTVLGKELPLKTKYLSIPATCNLSLLTEKIKQLCKELDDGDGILILTDLCGATPCNISMNCYQNNSVHVVSGVNLAMLIKIMNYHSLDLPALTKKSLDGGRNGVIECQK